MHRLRVVNRQERILMERMRQYALLLRTIYFDDLPTESWRAFNLSNYPGVENKFGPRAGHNRVPEKPRRV